ncbi:MAG: hypothetical protein M3451_08100 [Chloroflexota bacterium]|nr:hypothetical protein [Chloroflexota bacterium]
MGRRASVEPAIGCVEELFDGSRPRISGIATASSVEYAAEVHCTKSVGSKFRLSELRPKKPVPIVMVGARWVSIPELPVEFPTLTETRLTSTRFA